MPGQCRLMTINPRSTFTKSQSWQQKTWPQHHDRHQPPTPVETISSKVKIGVDNLHFTIHNSIPQNGAFKCQRPLLLLRSNSTKGFIGLATRLAAVYLHMSLAILSTNQSVKAFESICHVFGPNGNWKHVWRRFLVGHRLWAKSPKNYIYYNVGGKSLKQTWYEDVWSLNQMLPLKIESTESTSTLQESEKH